MVMTEQPLLTVRQVARRLQVSQLTVRRQVASGRLAAIKLGDAESSPLRIDPAELDRYLADHATGKAVAVQQHLRPTSREKVAGVETPATSGTRSGAPPRRAHLLPARPAAGTSSLSFP
jgi:excisionase family DNA binding protein